MYARDGTHLGTLDRCSSPAFYLRPGLVDLGLVLTDRAAAVKGTVRCQDHMDRWYVTLRPGLNLLARQVLTEKLRAFCGIVGA